MLKVSIVVSTDGCAAAFWRGLAPSEMRLRGTSPIASPNPISMPTTCGKVLSANCENDAKTLLHSFVLLPLRKYLLSQILGCTLLEHASWARVTLESVYQAQIVSEPMRSK